MDIYNQYDKQKKFGCFESNPHALSIIEECPHPFVKQARVIRNRISQANHDEASALMSLAQQTFISQKSSVSPVLNDAAQMLTQQESVTRIVFKKVMTNTAYPFILRSELKKILIRKSYQRAVLLLEEYGRSVLEGTLNTLPTQNQLTEFKLALLHLNCVLNPIFDPFKFMREHHLFHPFAIKEADRSLFLQIALFENQENTLWLPNAGYIDGGNLISGKLRGTDCSGFVALSVGAIDHLQTEDLALIWRADRGILPPHALPQEAKNELVNYQSIEPADLQAGDLVVWRWSEGAENLGHVVFFIAWRIPGITFLSLEAAMLPDRELDGIGTRELEIHREGASLYTLRRI